MGEDHESVQAAWVRGEVPWTGAGLAEAFARLPSLGGSLGTGDEEADRHPGHAGDNGVAGGSGAASHPAAREILWLISRYGEKEGPAHALRLFQVRRFLVAHRDRLVAERLVRDREPAEPDPDPADPAGSDPEGFVLTPGLTHALATLPYSRHMWDARTGGEDVVLDVDDVIIAARAFDELEGAEAAEGS